MLLQILAKTQAYVRCEKGATAIEYGLIAAGIAVAISAIVFTMGDQLLALFTNVSGDLGTAAAR